VLGIECRALRHSRNATITEYFSAKAISLQKEREAMSIRSTLIVTTAILATIATSHLSSPAFAASYGGLSNDSGSMRPSYYDQTGWHVGLPPGARAALGAPQQQSARSGRGLQLPKNDWFWDGSRY
jgi:hypothetical protein